MGRAFVARSWPWFRYPSQPSSSWRKCCSFKKKNERKKHVAPGGPLPPHSPPLATSLGDYIYLLFILHFSITKENLKVQTKSSKNGTDQGGKKYCHSTRSKYQKIWIKGRTNTDILQDLSIKEYHESRGWKNTGILSDLSITEYHGSQEWKVLTFYHI